MHRFLKDELGVKSLVAGTQMGWSPAHVQAALDYVDGHSYWQHPVFPGRPWDSRNWYVDDLALVNQAGGTLSDLASTRVAGKPYTVSEYNHPQPLTHAAEGFPMIAAFGAFQGWSAIYSFDYSGNNLYEPDKLDGYFDIKSDPSRLVHMPACAALFLRGDVAPARQTLLAPLSLEAERRQLRESRSAWTLTTDRFGVDAEWSLLHAIGLDLKAEKIGRAGQAVVLDQDLPLRHGSASLGCLAAGGRLFHGGHAPDQALHGVHPRTHVQARQGRPRDRLDPAGLGDRHDDGHRG